VSQPDKPAAPGPPTAPPELQARLDYVRRNFLRANRAVTVILAVVFLLGVAMVAASVRAHRSQQRAERAEAAATERLWHASLAQARAERLSIEAGHRAAALAAITNAAAIRSSVELRNEAIASLQAPDLVPDLFWPLKPGAYGYYFSHDLEHYVVSYARDALSVFRLADNALVATLYATNAGLPAAASVKEFKFSATARYVALLYSDGTFVLWDWRQNSPALSFDARQGRDQLGWEPSFSADDRLFAVVNQSKGGTVSVVDVASGATREPPLPAGGLRHLVRLSPRGDVLAMPRGRDVLLLDCDSGQVRQTFTAPANVEGLTWDTSGRQFVVACPDSTLYVWDVENGQARPLLGHAGFAGRHLFSPDGTLLMTVAAVDNFSRLWHVPSGSTLVRQPEATGYQFGADGQRIAFGRPGRAVGTWRITGRAFQRMAQGFAQERATVWMHDLSPDGRWFAWAPPPWVQPTGLEVFDVATGQVVLSLRRPSPVKIAFHPVEPWLLVGETNGLAFHELQESNNATGRSLRLGPAMPIMLPAGFSPWLAALSGGGDVTAVMGSDGRVVVLDARRPGQFVFLEDCAPKPDAIGAGSLTGSGRLAVSPDGKWVAVGVGFADRRPRLWEAATGKLARRLSVEEGNVTFSADGRWLVCAGKAECSLWSVGTWEQRWTRARPGRFANHGAAAFSRDGALLAVTRSAGDVELLAPAKGEELAVVSVADRLGMVGLRLSPDGHTLALAGLEGRVQFLDLGALRAELAKLRLDWDEPLVTPLASVAGGFWTAPAGVAGVGLAAVGAAALLALVVLRRHRQLTEEFIRTEQTALQHARELDVQREVARLKSGFVSMVSHEFRTPLGVILNAAQLLKNYFPRLSAEQRNEQFGEIETAVARMKDLIEEVLLLGRVETGRMECRPAPVDLAALCERVLGDVNAATQNRCPIELANAVTADQVTLDESLAVIILTNLLSNAVKYSEPGQPVRLALRRDARDLVIEVQDEGIGIPAADQPELFKSFRRGANVAQIPGTGLGLTIVKRCVDVHGGSITFTSQEGAGSTFTVRLPAFA
jgi:signal transduction histidine kinase